MANTLSHSIARRLSGPLCGIVLGSALLIVPAGASAAPGVEQSRPTATVSNNAPPPIVWVVTTGPTTAYSGPSTDTLAFGTVPALTIFQVLEYQDEFAHVVNPRDHTQAYVAADQLGPSDPPSRYLTMTPPPLTDQFDDAVRGVVTNGAALSMYPTPAEEAQESSLYPNTWLSLTGTVTGEDGSEWYRTLSGDFVPSDAVFVPARSDAFSGRWLDANLNSPVRVTAYEGDTPVRSFLAIKGTPSRPTPTGVFTILRRVANETMNSDTIGIPRFGPGGYYLTNVLFTQYFTGDGASFHYNYWSGMWGYAGSHGCLGLTYADSAWLWEWAHVGTPVVIHY